MSILHKILNEKKNEIAHLKETSFQTTRQKKITPFRTRVLSSECMSVIAEIKRASPSKGAISIDIDPVKQAIMYETLGASAISVLTDSTFFKGSFTDLKAVSDVVNVPVLCKDFIIDPIQIDQAKAAGSHMILLIVAALDDHQLQALFQYATNLDLEVLVEIHNVEELNQALDLGATLIGINNRNLNTFTVDLQTTTQLSALVKDPKTILVSESGIQTTADVLQVAEAGANAILVGETFMRSNDLSTTFQELRIPLPKKAR